jgi:hypothetical protein
MAAGSTYTPIATYTAPSAQTTVTFSSIAGTYTDLVLICNIAQAAGNNSLRIRYNSDTGSNYSRTYLLGDGSTASSGRTSSDVSGYLSETTGSTTLEFAVVAHIMNYSNTTTYKTHISRSNRASSSVDAVVGLWQSTSAITRIDLAMGGSFPTNNFATGSTFTLYGILAA